MPGRFGRPIPDHPPPKEKDMTATTDWRADLTAECDRLAGVFVTRARETGGARRLYLTGEKQWHDESRGMIWDNFDVQTEDDFGEDTPNPDRHPVLNGPLPAAVSIAQLPDVFRDILKR